MRFEVINALLDLDDRTPSFFIDEIFCHSQTETISEARKILTEMDPKKRSCRILKCMIEMEEMDSQSKDF